MGRVFCSQREAKLYAPWVCPSILLTPPTTRRTCFEALNFQSQTTMKLTLTTKRWALLFAPLILTACGGGDPALSSQGGPTTALDPSVSTQAASYSNMPSAPVMTDLASSIQALSSLARLSVQGTAPVVTEVLLPSQVAGQPNLLAYNSFALTPSGLQVLQTAANSLAQQLSAPASSNSAQAENGTPAMLVGLPAGSASGISANLLVTHQGRQYLKVVNLTQPLTPVATAAPGATQFAGGPTQAVTPTTLPMGPVIQPVGTPNVTAPSGFVGPTQGSGTAITPTGTAAPGATQFAGGPTQAVTPPTPPTLTIGPVIQPVGVPNATVAPGLVGPPAPASLPALLRDPSYPVGPQSFVAASGFCDQTHICAPLIPGQDALLWGVFVQDAALLLSTSNAGPVYVPSPSTTTNVVAPVSSVLVGPPVPTPTTPLPVGVVASPTLPAPIKRGF